MIEERCAAEDRQQDGWRTHACQHEPGERHVYHDGAIDAGGTNPRLPWYHAAEPPVTRGSACSGVCGTNPSLRNSQSASDRGSRHEIQIHRFRTSRSIARLLAMTRASRSRGASTMNVSRVGSWISTICQGKPVRRSLCAPSITPSSDVTLCGSFVPQP